MIKTFLTVATIGAVGYLALCLFLFLQQRSMLYYPTPAVSPARVDAKAIMLEHDGETLRVWKIPGTGQKALLYFGGNAEDVALNVASFRRLFPGWTIYLHNYRGYGGSSGRPTESGLVADAVALYDLVAPEHSGVAAMGRSLGSGIAIQLAADRPLERLVLVTPYDSMARLASTYYPWVPVTLLMLDRYDVRRVASTLAIPVLAIIAEHDEVIPAPISQGLIDVLDPAIARVAIIKGAGHNTIGSFPRYEEVLASFFD